MLRFLAGAVAALLLVGASFFVWTSWAGRDQAAPPAPSAAPSGALLQPRSSLPEPPAASEKTKEEKRFARADKDDDGKITRAELLEPRLKAFAKLDKNGNGALSFEEWAVKTGDKFAGADADKSGWLSPQEYETTKPKPKRKPKCDC